MCIHQVYGPDSLHLGQLFPKDTPMVAKLFRFAVLVLASSLLASIVQAAIRS